MVVDTQVDRLKVSDGSITTVSPMQQPRAWAAAVVCEECIFVFGGCDRRFNPLSSSETYDPMADRQVVGDTQFSLFSCYPFVLQWYIHLKIHFRWTQLPDMPTPRLAAAAVHLPGLGILVVSGVGESDRPLRTTKLQETRDSVDGNEGRWPQ